MGTKAIRNAALRKANQVRKRMGFGPVDHLYPGKPNLTASCPITNTVYDDDVPRDKFVVLTGTEDVKVFDIADTEFLAYSPELGRLPKLGAKPVVTVKHSDGSAGFIDAFDGHEIPDLIS